MGLTALDYAAQYNRKKIGALLWKNKKKRRSNPIHFLKQRYLDRR